MRHLKNNICTELRQYDLHQAMYAAPYKGILLGYTYSIEGGK